LTAINQMWIDGKIKRDLYFMEFNSILKESNLKIANAKDSALVCFENKVVTLVKYNSKKIEEQAEVMVGTLDDSLSYFNVVKELPSDANNHYGFSIKVDKPCKALTSLALSFSDYGKFFVIPNASEAKVHILFGKLEYHDFSLTNDYAAIMDFLTEHRFPILTKLGMENSDYFMSHHSIFFPVIGDTDKFEEYYHEIKLLFEPLKAKLNGVSPRFAYIHKNELNPSFASEMDPNFDGIQIMVSNIKKPKASKIFVNYSSDKIEEFMKRFDEIQEDKSMKSQVEKPLDAYPYELVGSNVDQFVSQATVPILIYVHASWCTFCKKFGPIFKEFAQKNNQNANLIVAMIDGSENDTPFNISGFPTILLVLPGNPNPIKFESNHSEENYIKFVKKHVPNFKEEVGTVNDEL